MKKLGVINQFLDAVPFSHYDLVGDRILIDSDCGIAGMMVVRFARKLLISRFDIIQHELKLLHASGGASQQQLEELIQKVKDVKYVH